MRRSLGSWQVAGFGFTAAMGTLLHFLYEWTGSRPWVGLVSAVNESVWEHMKLLFVPLLVFGLVEGRFVRQSGYWCAKLVGTLVGLALIPVLYYTYTGALGIRADWFNIAIFYIAAAVVYRLEYRLMQWGKLTCPKWLPALVLWALTVAFGVLTFFPPEIPLFRE